MVPDSPGYPTPEEHVEGLVMATLILGVLELCTNFTHTFDSQSATAFSKTALRFESMLLS
jgi:hypothetical protein